MAKRYKPGQNKLICDRTGFVIKTSEAKKEWNGQVVRRESYEERHPQDTIRAVKDDQTPEIVRSEADWNFLSDNEVTADDL